MIDSISDAYCLEDLQDWENGFCSHLTLRKENMQKQITNGKLRLPSLV